MAACPRCGSTVDERDRYCPYCGYRLTLEKHEIVGRRDPMTAAILNFFILGAGYLYIGDVILGALLLVAWMFGVTNIIAILSWHLPWTSVIFSWLAGIFLGIATAYDVYERCIGASQK